MNTTGNQLQTLFDTDNLFNVHPPSAFSTASVYFTVFFLLIAVWIIAPFVLKTMFPAKGSAILRQFLRKITSYFATASLLGVFLVWCRIQYIAFFSMRIWLLSLVLLQIGMALYFIYEARILYPRFMSMYRQQLEKEKYLPKRKTRK
ncbi:hypothetical protein AUK40_01085 [Candidatus Wirthbacteria bacterium CG2_30_54_11]|uniref:Uncharacterized protein n=1 Tax=Candidatus Wirthbacteria bacterium CG2_30_54_11 TaxID=1817892 RepID=A0A1J5INM6_9BACT|nr:MAG: hypothetical protein AUK40_01085 [Candidatus Wirthbacteria bacterium CG2_30_54_11]